MQIKSNNMTVEQDYTMRINFCINDLLSYKTCRKHNNENVIDHAFNHTYCYECQRDHLLLQQLRSLTDMFRYVGVSKHE